MKGLFINDIVLQCGKIQERHYYSSRTSCYIFTLFYTWTFLSVFEVTWPVHVTMRTSHDLRPRPMMSQWHHASCHLHFHTFHTSTLLSSHTDFLPYLCSPHSLSSILALNLLGLRQPSLNLLLVTICYDSLFSFLFLVASCPMTYALAFLLSQWPLCLLPLFSHNGHLNYLFLSSIEQPRSSLWHQLYTTIFPTPLTLLRFLWPTTVT
jgi:hypothetical protein